jgi:hypothetical protein
MKKLLLLAAVAALTLNVALSGQSITVTSPTAGNEWCLGSPHSITWTKSGTMPATVAVRLRRAGSPESELAVWNLTDSTPNDGSYGPVTVPASVPTGDYFIRVRTSSPDVIGDSATFKITTTPASSTVKLGSPNGGESWVLGSEHTVNWNSTNLTGKVQLDLMIYKGETQQWMIGVIKDNLPANGSYQWKAGEYSVYTAAPGQYRIRVRSMTNNDYSDLSDAPFHLSLLAQQFKKPLLFKTPITKKPQITNWLGTDSFGTSNPIPTAAWQGRPKCDGQSNTLAMVGAEWFAYDYYRVGLLYRSRLVFHFDGLQGQASGLLDAKLKLKQVSQVHSGQNNDASCASKLCILLGPWNSFDAIQIDCIANLSLWQTEYTVDVTETVRKWLDGTLANDGFMMFGREAPTSKDFACFSCYEVSLLLRFE